MTSTDHIESDGCSGAEETTLGERLSQGSLPFVSAIRVATEVAAALRDLHAYGLEYGAVNPHTILLGPGGAVLRSTEGLRHIAGHRSDVAGFGAVLGQMLGSEELASRRLALLRVEAVALASRCQDESPQLQQVLIELRLLGVRARQAGAVVRQTRCQLPAPAPAVPAVKERRPGPQGGVSWQLKSLAVTAFHTLVGLVTGGAVIKST